MPAIEAHCWYCKHMLKVSCPECVERSLFDPTPEARQIMTPKQLKERA